MGSTANMRSGLRAVGALRPEAEASCEPVALETAVVATGARPGDAAAKRQLFTEETRTVLVFERGAVIRLSAAVADGQLLFLTNEKTGKEVVTQVKRKRSFRPTNCYVDLEFTEASPGFWGIEFPKAAPAVPSEVATDGDSEGSGNPSATHGAPPTQQEVERLKNEVAELQTRLKSLTVSGPSNDPAKETPGTRQVAATAPAVAEPASEAARKVAEEKILEQLLQQAAAQEQQLAGPKRLVAYPQKSSASSPVKKAGKAATAGAIAALVAAAGFAVYRFGLLDSVIGSVIAAKPPSSSVTASVPEKPAATASLPAAAPKPVEVSPSTSSGAGAALAPERPATAAGEKAGSAEVLPRATAPTEAPPTSGSLAKRGVPVETKQHANGAVLGLAASSTTTVVPPARNTSAVSDSAGATSGSGEYTAPKLVHAVKPVSPPEALRNYISGNVNVDALIDATGHVRSVTVLSGPQKLRNTAIQVMKQYVYKPARKDGKPVTSHVQASLQFWYEP